MKFLHLLTSAVVLAGLSGPCGAEETWLRPLGLDANAPILTLPAAAGPVVGFEPRLTGDSLTQTTTFQGDPETRGQNSIVTIVTRSGLAKRVADVDVESEMEDRLPGVDMRVSSYPARNAFGIFGYALGARGPVLCVYAWQALDNADVWLTGRNAGFFSERHALSMRIRLCRTHMNAAALVELAQGAARAGRAPIRTTNRGGYDALCVTGGCCGQCAPRAMAALTPSAPMRLAIPAAGPATPMRRPARLARRSHARPAIEFSATLRRSDAAEPRAAMPAVPMPQ